MSDIHENGETAEEELIKRHKKERKELQGKVLALKKSSNKYDKKRKKEVLEEIARLETELDLKQEEELNKLKASNADVTDLSDAIGSVELNSPEEEKVSDDVDKVDDDMPASNNQQRVSKAQRRRDKRSSQQKERNERIAQEEAEAALNGPRAIEGRAIGKILSSRNLELHQIPSDGNCLYGAIDHQLSLVGKSMGVMSLRKLTAEHLRQNQNDFLPFITPLADSGDPLNDEEYSMYCDRVEHSQEAWGGQVELRALSNVLHLPIEVLQGSGPPVILGTEFKDSSKVNGEPQTLILTYHRHAYGLGEHYNSVRPKAKESDQLEGQQLVNCNK
ncbi:deubiquitinase OTUD6B [Ischnura elegans]|uniref:deubiquitinase OTUD6B n=1 Tax=Ischnura elegans TaxID=197161 RepID=UPI001ED89274|nr:deubiquitinase OTUD6B [Ischnura elegans]